MISMLSHPIQDKNQQNLLKTAVVHQGPGALFAQYRRADPVHHDASLATRVGLHPIITLW